MLLFQISFVVYWLAMVIYLVFAFTQREDIRNAARKIFFAAATIHTANILTRLIESGHTPITTVHETVSFFAWSVAWCYLSFRWRYTIKNFGTFAAVFVMVLMSISAIAPQNIIPLSPSFDSWLFPVHACLSIIANAFLALAFLGAIMHLLQERELKQKRFGFFYSRLPSLESLERLNHHCLSAGFALMTLGMFVGYVWARQLWGGHDWLWQPKIIAAMITWFLYAVLLHRRLTMGWRGRRSAIITIIAFSAVLLTMVFLFKGVGIHGG